MKEFFWPMGPKFPSNMLQSSPSSTWVQVWSIEHSCWWHNNITFMVRRLLGDNGISLLMSLRDSTVRGLELMIASVSATSVLNPSSLRLWPWVFSKATRIVLALRIWRSQTPPICEAPGGFLYHVIQSVPFCRRYVSYLFLIHFFQSLSELIVSTNKICSIIRSYWSYHALSCHESTQSLDKGINLHCASYLNMYCPTCKTGK